MAPFTESMVLSESQPPSLSICIPYYAGSSYLRRCLRSVATHPPAAAYEVIIVDDAGPEPYADDLSRGVRYERNSRNSGFGATVNHACRLARGEYLLVMNSDVEVDAGTFDALLRPLHDDAGIAASGPMVRNADGSFQPQCRRGRLTPWSGFLYATGLDRWLSSPRRPGYLLSTPPVDRPCEVEALSGACMLVRREAFEAVGGFDESLILYGEDLDLCYRLTDAGWRLRYEPTARVLHHGGAGGTGVRFFHSRYHYHRSLSRLFAKHGGRSYRLYGWAVDAGLALRFVVTAAIDPLRGRGVATPKRGRRNVASAR